MHFCYASASFFLIWVDGAEIPSPDEVITRQLVPPTIEELSGGKVKDGDIIDKNNMDLVKEYLPTGAIECINQGMKMNLAMCAENPLNVPLAKRK